MTSINPMPAMMNVAAIAPGFLKNLSDASAPVKKQQRISDIPPWGRTDSGCRRRGPVKGKSVDIFLVSFDDRLKYENSDRMDVARPLKAPG